MLDRVYADRAWEYAQRLLAIDSPTGYTLRAAEWVKTAFEKQKNMQFMPKPQLAGGMKRNAESIGQFTI